MPEPGNPDGVTGGVASIHPELADQPAGDVPVVPFGDGTNILRAGAVGHFRVDVDRAPQAIAAFQKAADDMRTLLKRAQDLANIPAPGLDAVSVNAVREMGQWAVGPDGSLRAALLGGSARLEDAARELQRQLDAHLQAEQASTMRPGESGL